MTKTPGKLGTAKTAERIGISVGQLAKLRMKGQGPEYYLIGGKILYGIADIDAWLAQCKRTKNDPAPNHWKRRGDDGKSQAEPQAA